MEDLKRSLEELTGIVKTFVNDLKEKYPDRELSMDFIIGYVEGHTAGLKQAIKETSNDDASY